MQICDHTTQQGQPLLIIVKIIVFWTHCGWVQSHITFYPVRQRDVKSWDSLSRWHPYRDPVSGGSNLKLMLPIGMTVLHEGIFPESNRRPSSLGYGDCFSEAHPCKDPGLWIQNKSFPPCLSPDLRTKETTALLNKGCLPESWEKSSCHEVKGICSSKLKNPHSVCVCLTSFW